MNNPLGLSTYLFLLFLTVHRKNELQFQRHKLQILDYNISELPTT
ncbi:MAG: hypothetical protein ACJASM_002947 [Salibacteraceae bacterium]|jgi:hypothetical protein